MYKIVIKSNSTVHLYCEKGLTFDLMDSVLHLKSTKFDQDQGAGVRSKDKSRK